MNTGRPPSKRANSSSWPTDAAEVGQRRAWRLTSSRGRTARVRVQHLRDVGGVVARPVPVEEPQHLVQVLAVLGGRGRVARRHGQQVLVPPPAAAPRPSGERRRVEGHDRGADVARAAHHVHAVAVRRAAPHVAARPAVAARVSPCRPRPSRAHHLEPGDEAVAEVGETRGDRDRHRSVAAAEEVGPRDSQRLITGPPRQAEDRHPDRGELERVLRRRPAPPEVELAKLRDPVVAEHGQIDPSAHPHAVAPRDGRMVTVVQIGGDRPRAEPVAVPVGGVGEHPLLLGLQRRRRAQRVQARWPAVRWATRAASRNASRSRARGTGLPEPDAPMNSARSRRAHRVSAEVSIDGVTRGRTSLPASTRRAYRSAARTPGDRRARTQIRVAHS